MGREVEVEFDRVVRETESAYLCAIGEGFDPGDREFWLPKKYTDMGADQTFAMIPEWLALEKGLV